MIRTLVAEDSVTARELLVAILSSDSEMCVIGQARNGVEAVEMARRHRPDLVTMDVKMPLMDGFEATRRIMNESPTPIVIVSGLDLREVEASMNALGVGALAVLPKPIGPQAPDFPERSRRFIQELKAMAQVRVVRRWSMPSATVAAARKTCATSSEAWPRARIVAVAASTGGPSALSRVLGDLGGDFPAPIVVVQHIAPGYVAGFASWLRTSVALQVKVAESDEPLLPRTVYVAPDDGHLGIGKSGTVLISSAPPIGGFRPSASFLFESVAATFGRATLAVVLTGMGEDGVAGLRAVRRVGGKTIAQDEESSVVFGMPGAAVASGLSDATLPLSAIGARLVRSSSIDMEGR